MKTRNILTLLVVLLSFSLFAQGRLKEKKEQIKTLKVAYITEQLALTSDEAEKFWPIYNAFDDKQFELRKEKMEAFRKRMDDSVDKMTDKEASALLAQMESTETELYQLKKKLVADLKPIIGSVKIVKLKKAEEDFNRKLLQQFKKRRE